MRPPGHVWYVDECKETHVFARDNGKATTPLICGQLLLPRVTSFLRLQPSPLSGIGMVPVALVPTLV